MAETATAGILSPDEVAFYHEHGYVVPRFRVPEATLRTLRSAVDRILEERPSVRPEDLVNPHMFEWPGRNPFLDLAHDPEILDMVEQVAGPDLLLWIVRILCKPAGHGREVPWHQDGQYWPIDPLATCSVWVAVDAATPENGCLRFIPGSHKRQTLYRHRVIDRENIVLNQELEPEEFDENTAVDVILEPGQISLHDIRMIHGSKANRSAKRRAGLIMRYMPATSHFQRERADIKPGGVFNIFDQPLFQVRERDVSGRNDLTRGHWPR